MNAIRRHGLPVASPLGSLGRPTLQGRAPSDLGPFPAQSTLADPCARWAPRGWRLASALAVSLKRQTIEGAYAGRKEGPINQTRHPKR
jgi:hypothetical protein